MTEELNNVELIDNKFDNSLQRRKGRPWGKTGPYKPRLPKELNDNIDLKAEDLNIIELNTEEKPNAALDFQLNNNEDLNLDDIKNLSIVPPSKPTFNAPPRHQPKPQPRQYFTADQLMGGKMSYGKMNSDDDDDKERSDIIAKLHKYQSSFTVCAALNINFDAKTSVLKCKLEDCRNAVNNKNTHAIFKTTYLTTVKGVEFIGSRSGMKLYGLSSMLGQSEEVDSILKEMSIEMMGGFRLPAHQRLIMCTLSSAMIINNMNSKAELLNNFTKEPIKEDIEDRYKDL